MPDLDPLETLLDTVKDVEDRLDAFHVRMDHLAADLRGLELLEDTLADLVLRAEGTERRQHTLNKALALVVRALNDVVHGDLAHAKGTLVELMHLMASERRA